MIHIKIYESYNNLGEIELISVEEAPLYKAFDIHINYKKVGTVDVGFYKEDLKNNQAEIVGISINSEFRGMGIGKLAVNKLFLEFPNIDSFIAMPTEESIGFWKSIGATEYYKGYFIIKRNSSRFID